MPHPSDHAGSDTVDGIIYNYTKTIHIIYGFLNIVVKKLPKDLVKIDIEKRTIVKLNTSKSQTTQTYQGPNPSESDEFSTDFSTIIGEPNNSREMMEVSSEADIYDFAKNEENSSDYLITPPTSPVSNRNPVKSPERRKYERDMERLYAQCELDETRRRGGGSGMRWSDYEVTSWLTVFKNEPAAMKNAKKYNRWKKFETEIRKLGVDRNNIQCCNQVNPFFFFLGYIVIYKT